MYMVWPQIQARGLSGLAWLSQTTHEMPLYPPLLNLRKGVGGWEKLIRRRPAPLQKVGERSSCAKHRRHRRKKKLPDSLRSSGTCVAREWRDRRMTRPICFLPYKIGDNLKIERHLSDWRATIYCTLTQRLHPNDYFPSYLIQCRTCPDCDSQYKLQHIESLRT